MPAAIYAVGDIHGCHHLMVRLEKAIAADAAGFDGEVWIVYLGDYIDRGPASQLVIDHLMSPAPQGFRRICLAGNHEEIAWDFIRNKNYSNNWLDFGGRETLASYGLYDVDPHSRSFEQRLATQIPTAHIDFLGSLPSMLVTPGYCFVHAGIDPSLSLGEQSDKVLLWSRPTEFPWSKATNKFCVVHGHTPVTTPEISLRRINIDLGAYATGKLGAIRIRPANDPSVILAES